jgi:hypothetical protein
MKTGANRNETSAQMSVLFDKVHHLSKVLTPLYCQIIDSGVVYLVSSIVVKPHELHSALSPSVAPLWTETSAQPFSLQKSALNYWDCVVYNLVYQKGV